MNIVIPFIIFVIILFIMFIIWESTWWFTFRRYRFFSYRIKEKPEYSPEWESNINIGKDKKLHIKIKEHTEIFYTIERKFIL